MGIKLMVEIFDHWQDAGLTLGERSDLLVLAENANDRTRETWPKGGVHQDYIRKRAGKTAESWKNAIAKLVKKGVLSYAVRDGRELVGFPGQAAVYRIALLCPEAPHDGLMGQCTRAERSTPTVTLSERAEPEKGHLSEGMGHLPEKKGHLSEGEWSTPEVTPTPPYPSSKSPSTTSTSPAGPSEPEPQSEPEPTDGGGGGSDLRSTAIHVAASLDYEGKPPTRKQRTVIEDRLLVWLEAGWSMEGLVVILDIAGQQVRHAPTVYALRLDPAEMPAPEPLPAPALSRGGARGRVPSAEEYASLTVEEALFGSARPKAPAKSWAEASANVRQRMAGVGGGAREHQPFRNPVDDSVYDEPFWPTPPKPPWCGDPDCSETDRMREVEDAAGFKFAKQCPACHPDRASAA